MGADTRSPGPWAIALAGMASLGVAMGIGRFAFTPILPMMLADGVLDLAAASWLASANYLGYLVGALLCMLLLCMLLLCMLLLYVVLLMCVRCCACCSHGCGRAFQVCRPWLFRSWCAAAC